MELLPCPFCGEAAEIVGEFELDVVACQTCYARTDAFAGDDGDYAAAAWNRRAANAPADPALLALAKFGALVVEDHLSPTGGFTHARFEALDRAGLVAGVIVPGGETGPVAAPGIADAIAALLPDGAASEEVDDGD